jgi:hypothetical protein
MTPADVSVVLVDGHVHAVTSKVEAVNDTELVRYECGCELTVDAPVAELDSDPRWTQGAPVDCPNGC